MSCCKKITHDLNCNIIVKDAENYDDNFAYIYVLQLNKYNSAPISQIFVKTAENQMVEFQGQDGYYTLCELKISKDEKQPYYFKDNKIYKGEEEVSITEVLNVNPEFTGVEINYYYYFQTCFLRKQYVNIAQKIINSVASIKCEPKVNSQDSYIRDLLWSALNVIDYLIDNNCYTEAERILERISGCNGLYENNSNCNCLCGH